LLNTLNILTILKRYSRSLLFLELLQYDFFRKGLEISTFMVHLKFLIEKDWIESSEIEKETKKYYKSIIEGSVEDSLNDLNGVNNDESYNNEINLNSNLAGLNRRSSI